MVLAEGFLTKMACFLGRGIENWALGIEHEEETRETRERLVQEFPLVTLPPAPCLNMDLNQFVPF